MISTAPTITASWTSVKFIRGIKDAAKTYPSSIRANSDGLMRLRIKLWIQPGADNLEIKIITNIHAVRAEHRSVEATAALLRDSFIWKGLSDDETEFFANCLL